MRISDFLGLIDPVMFCATYLMFWQSDFYETNRCPSMLYLYRIQDAPIKS